MLKTFVALFVLMTCLTACAHRGAVRVACDAALRPINGSGAASSHAPVSVAPATPDGPRGESRP
jgi:hypothetical protein